MGPGISSNSSFLRITQSLSEGNCKPTHQIWQGISSNDLTGFSFDQSVFNALEQIENKYPENFSLLVRKAVDIFSQTSDPSTMCEVILTLLGVSSSSDPWIQTPELYVSSLIPINTILTVLFKNLDQEKSTFNLDQKLMLLKTTCLAFHAGYLNSKRPSIPDAFVAAFEHVSSVNFIKQTFDFLGQRNSNQKHVTVARAFAALSSAAIDSCTSWKTALKSIDHAEIHMSFIPFLEFNLHPIDDAIVSVLYITLLHYPSFTRFLELNNLGTVYIVALLYFLQIRAETGKTSFIQTVALLCIGRLTASYQTLLQLNIPFGGKFPTKLRIHRGSHADLVVEVLTNISMRERALEGIISAIFVNLSSTTISLSTLSASRLFGFLKKSVKNDGICERVLTAVFQIIRFQFPGNYEVLLQSISCKRVLREISGKGKETADRILEIVDLLDPLVRSGETDAKKRETALSIFSKYSEEPIKPVAFTVTREGEFLWKDWLRVLTWQAFPEESRRYRLGFVSFEMPNDKVDNVKQQSEVKTEKVTPSIEKSDLYVKPSESKDSLSSVAIDAESYSPVMDSNPDGSLADPLPAITSNPFGDEEDFQNFLNGM